MNLNTIRLSTRITLGMLLLVAVGALLWIVPGNTRVHDAYLNDSRDDLESGLKAEELRLKLNIEALRQDTLFLANLPPITGIMRAAANRGIDPRDKNTYATWERRLQEIFAAFLRTHPQYYRVRYIGVADDGRELVRVDNRDGRVEAIPREVLQPQGDRDFFKAGLSLPVGRVYLSEFSLNQENDKVSQPHRPTLRAVTPVFDATGHVFGMLVINQDVASLFDSAKTGLPVGVQALIADQQGRYLSHPDAKRAFSFDLGGKDNIIGDFPSLKPLFDSQKQNYLPLQAMADHNGNQYLAAQRVFFDNNDPARFLLLAYRLPEEVVAAQTSHIVWPSIVDTLLVMLLVGAVLFVVMRRTFSPLERITAAAQQIAAGKRDVRLSRAGGGEISELADALNSMLDKLLAKDLLEQENRFRKELIDLLPGVFYMIDVQNKFLMWNRNLERVLQCSAGELTVSHPLDFFRVEDKEKIEHTIGQVFSEGESSVEAMLVAKDGTEVPYYFTGRRVLRDGAPVLIGIGLDISEQRASMRTTQTLLRRYQALMENSMGGIHVMDLVGNVLEVNDAFCRMLGYSREEALQLNVADWNAQWTKEQLLERFKSLIGRSAQFDTVHRRKDGSLFPVEITTSGIEFDSQVLMFASSIDISARKQSEAAMQRHNLVIETAMDGFWMVNMQGVLLEVNQAYARMTGYTIEELVGMHISQLDMNDSPDDVAVRGTRIMKLGGDRFETRHRRKDGTIIDMEVAITFMPTSESFFVFSHDITRRKRNEENLRVAATTFETQNATLITDAQADIIRVNRAFTRITGYTAEEVLGKNPRIMSSGRQDKAFYTAMWQQILKTNSWAGEIWDRRKNGEIYPKWLTINAVKNEKGETTQYVAIFNDITDLKQAEEEIRNLAFYDALTQLPNRRLLHERLHAALIASTRYADFGAILFIDLDRFKVLNDTLGHDYGDLLLIEVALRITSCVREMDTVARLGGDEFVVLLESISGDKEEASHNAGLVAEKIRETLARPYFLKEHEYFSSPSIGITLYHGDAENMDVLLKHADAAMYQAKSAGRNAVRFYDPSLQHEMVLRSTLESDLRHAIGNNELHLYYQMQVDNERRPLGAEALLRWIHPQQGMISPLEFIPVAEESSLILEIGNWVLETGCAQLATWSKDERMRELTLAINVSAHQFHMHDFVGKVEGVLRRHRFDCSHLKLELTESVVVDDIEDVVTKMLALKGLGVLLSMDDFGTGYSSLSYLKRLPLDQVKIDQSFVRGITVDPGDAVMVQTIIDMAKNFKLDVIAEGVETEEQFDFLKQHDCKAYQGYLFSKPVPLAEMEAKIGDQG